MEICSKRTEKWGRASTLNLICSSTYFEHPTGTNKFKWTRHSNLRRLKEYRLNYSEIVESRSLEMGQNCVNITILYKMLS